MLVLEWKIGDARFLFHRKLRPMKQKTLREDAHSREAETCRKRPRSARECAKAHSFLCVIGNSLEFPIT